MDFVSTRRGGVSLLYEGWGYHRKKFYSNGNTFWLCRNNNAVGCSGSITLNPKNEMVKFKTHDCLQDHANNKVQKELDQLKQTTSCNLESIQKQYDNMVHKLENEGYEILEKIPDFQSVKTGLYNERNRVLGAKKTRFRSCLEVVVPEKYKNFLLADYHDEDEGTRIILFCNKKVRALIHRFKHILCDGTFKASTSSFKQLYSIHGRNEKTSAIHPLIFCLLPDKSYNTYKILFELIKTNFPTWQIEKVTIDYELAAINGISAVYPEIEIKGCFYHFNRCLYRKAKHLKINSPVKRRHVARCAGLARLPVKYVKRGNAYIMKKSPLGEDIRKFNKYFSKQWNAKTVFSIICNCDKETIRTTNNIEGWHSRINRYIGRSKPNIAILLETLSKETKMTDIFKKRTKKAAKYIEIDKEIDDAIIDLKKKKITVGHCLEIICPYSFCF